MKPLTFTSTLRVGLPRLAWLAVVDFEEGTVKVFHGRDVEIGDHWLVEGVWDGPFGSAGFLRAQHFFGSGLVVDGLDVWLVPSCALVDRLLFCRSGSSLIASNSLPLILAQTGASLRRAVDYRQEAMAILDGVDEYQTVFRISHESIDCMHQIYNDPVRFDAVSSSRRSRRAPHVFHSYAEYVDALSSVLVELRDNFSSRARQTPVVPYTTISSGYDSTAVSALVKDFSVRAAFTSRRSNSSILPWMSRHAAIDDGGPIAEIIGIKTRYLDSDTISRDELQFLAATAAEPETAFAAMAHYLAEQAETAAVFTGFHGDKVWDSNVGPEYLSRKMKRGDTSGLNLGEIRLKAGFFNVAVPFIFAEEIESIAELSRSSEMQPWSVGGDYDRPIPRRIVESAGVLRGYFGIRKKAIVQYYSFPKNETLRKAYREWLGVRHGRSYFGLHLIEGINHMLFLGARVLEVLLQRMGLDFEFATVRTIESGIDLPHELHVWAVGELARDYQHLLIATDTES